MTVLENPHAAEFESSHAVRTNALRAAVLGANDGIVSVAGLVMGVAGATANSATIFLAGLAGLVAGALSMAAGEYVSVSTQRDTEIALLDKERRELAEKPEAELAELAAIYQAKGLSATTAQQVAEELTAHDAFAAHAEAELHIDPQALTNPWHAAFASLVAFALGAALPLLTITVAPAASRIVVTVAAVICALALTGYVSATLGRSPWQRALVRNVCGGILAMGVTYLVGTLFSVHVG